LQVPAVADQLRVQCLEGHAASHVELGGEVDTPESAFTEAFLYSITAGEDLAYGRVALGMIEDVLSKGRDAVSIADRIVCGIAAERAEASSFLDHFLLVAGEASPLMLLYKA